MWRANNLIPHIADMDNLRLAFWKAARGKSASDEVWIYRENLQNQLLDLHVQILTGDVSLGNYRYFKVYDPKEREICASSFSEQVLQHALMNVCHPFFDRKQIYDSYASRPGKGTYAALDRAKYYTLRHEWYLKLDVRKFFSSIPHLILKRQLGLVFKDPALLDIFYRIIDTYENAPERGLPIGNLSSQYFANHFLSGLDHFIKEKLKVRAYVRYMDDMVLWDKSREALKANLKQIDEYVRIQLLCELKPPQLNRCTRGLPFLGYRLYPRTMHLSAGSAKRLIVKYKELKKTYERGTVSEVSYGRRLQALFAFVCHADSEELRKRIILREEAG